MDPFDVLPTELWHEIRRFLADEYDTRDLVRLQRTCRAAHALKKGDLMAPFWSQAWKQLRSVPAESDKRDTARTRKRLPRMMNACLKDNLFAKLQFAAAAVQGCAHGGPCNQCSIVMNLK